MLKCKVCTIMKSHKHLLCDFMNEHGFDYRMAEYENGMVVVYLGEENATMLKLKSPNGNTDVFINLELIKKMDVILKELEAVRYEWQIRTKKDMLAEWKKAKAYFDDIN